jgi:hypothetical protein
MVSLKHCNQLSYGSFYVPYVTDEETEVQSSKNMKAETFWVEKDFPAP